MGEFCPVLFKLLCKLPIYLAQPEWTHFQLKHDIFIYHKLCGNNTCMFTTGLPLYLHMHAYVFFFCVHAPCVFCL